MSNDLDELVVVNPDHNVVRVAKELCHFEGRVTWYSDLDDYLRSFSDVVQIESKPERIPAADLPKDTSPHDLYINCRTCGVEFRAGIRTNPRSFATSQFVGIAHTCPNGHTKSYDKGDYVLRRVEE